MIERGSRPVDGSNPEIVLNPAAGLFLTAGERNFRRLVEMAERAGITSFSLLPFRALVGDEEFYKDYLSLNGHRIAGIEEAWNSYDTGFKKGLFLGAWGQIKRLGGDRSEPPILQDAFLLGGEGGREMVKRLMGKFPEAKFIAYSPEASERFGPERTLLAVYRPFGKTEEEVVGFAQERKIAGLIFDPRHCLSVEQSVSYSDAPVKPDLGARVKELERLVGAGGEVDWVDLHPTDQGATGVASLVRPSRQVRDFCQGRGFLTELVGAAKDLKINRFRIKAVLPLPEQIKAARGGRSELLAEMADALRAV